MRFGLIETNHPDLSSADEFDADVSRPEGGVLGTRLPAYLKRVFKCKKY